MFALLEMRDSATIRCLLLPSDFPCRDQVRFWHLADQLSGTSTRPLYDQSRHLVTPIAYRTRDALRNFIVRSAHGRPS